MGGRNGMEWKRIKKTILEYSSLPLFGSFNGVNGKSIPLFRRAPLRRMEWNENNIFRIFFPLSCLGVLMERMKSSFLCLRV